MRDQLPARLRQQGGSLSIVSTAASLERAGRWAASALGRGVELKSITPLRPNGSPWLLEISNSGDVHRAVLKAGSVAMREELATEAAALRLAEEHDIPAPQALASDLDGDKAGCLTLLITFIDGSDRIPIAAEPDRLRQIGAAAARIHSIPLTPTEELPLRDRPMPWIDFSAERRQGQSPTTPLLARADRLLDELPKPPCDQVFVHGDLWAGNFLWRDGTHVATIDWEAAGAGSAGVDLGSLRLDAALLYDQSAADEVQAGWESAAGRRATDVAYWDLVAALDTSADMSGAAATVQQAGRPDLTDAGLARRRDAFLHTALDHFA